MMKTIAPTITSKGKGRWLYPAPGTAIHEAWETAWSRLVVAGDEFLDGPLLATEVAGNHGLHPDTIKNLLNSARNAGHLEHTYRRVDVPGRGPRTRTHYRIRRDSKYREDA
jgi:hypothetical protein